MNGLMNGLMDGLMDGSVDVWKNPEFVVDMIQKIVNIPLKIELVKKKSSTNNPTTNQPISQ